MFPHFKQVFSQTTRQERVKQIPELLNTKILNVCSNHLSTLSKLLDISGTDETDWHLLMPPSSLLLRTLSGDVSGESSQTNAAGTEATTSPVFSLLLAKSTKNHSRCIKSAGRLARTWTRVPEGRICPGLPPPDGRLTEVSRTPLWRPLDRGIRRCKGLTNPTRWLNFCHPTNT